MGVELWPALLAALLHLQYIYAISVGGDAYNSQIGSAVIPHCHAGVHSMYPVGAPSSWPAGKPPGHPQVLCDSCRAARNEALRDSSASPPKAVNTATPPYTTNTPSQRPTDQPAQAKRKATLTIHSFLSPSILPSLMKTIQSGNTASARNNPVPDGASAKMTYYQPPSHVPSAPRTNNTSTVSYQTYPKSNFNKFYAPQALFQTLPNPMMSVPINNILSTESSTKQNPVSSTDNPTASNPRIVILQTSQPGTQPAPLSANTLPPIFQAGKEVLESHPSLPPAEAAPAQLQRRPKSTFLQSMLPLLFGMPESGFCRCHGFHDEFTTPQIYGGYANRPKSGRLTDSLGGRGGGARADAGDSSGDGSSTSGSSDEEASDSDFSTEESAE